MSTASARLSVLGASADQALAGTDRSGGGAVAVTLRAGERPPAAEKWLVWAADAAGAAAAATAGADRVLAPDGDGLWRRAPWPARDALFELPDPPRDPAVLVVADHYDGRESAMAALAGRGIEADADIALTRAGIAAAGAVLLIGNGVLPAAGMAPLAAERLLVTVNCATTFGLVPGIDHLAADGTEFAAALVDVALAEWDAFTPMRRLGRLAAERHRASVVYERVLEDLALEAGAS